MKRSLSLVLVFLAIILAARVQALQYKSASAVKAERPESAKPVIVIPPEISDIIGKAKKVEEMLVPLNKKGVPKENKRLVDRLVLGGKQGLIDGFTDQEAKNELLSLLKNDMVAPLNAALLRDSSQPRSQRLSSENKKVFSEAAGPIDRQDTEKRLPGKPLLLVQQAFYAVDVAQKMTTRSPENLKKLAEQVAALKKTAQLANLYNLPKELVKSGSTWPAKDTPETTALRKMLGTVYREIGHLYKFIIDNLEDVVRMGAKKKAEGQLKDAQTIQAEFIAAATQLLQPTKEIGQRFTGFDKETKQTLITLCHDAAKLLKQELSKKTLSRTNTYDFTVGQTRPERLLQRVFMSASSLAKPAPEDIDTAEKRRALISLQIKNMSEEMKNEGLLKLPEQMRKPGSGWPAKDSLASTTLRNMLATLYEEIGKIYTQVLNELDTALKAVR